MVSPPPLQVALTIGPLWVTTGDTPALAKMKEPLIEVILASGSGRVGMGFDALKMLPLPGANESVMNNHRPAPSYWLWFDVGLRAGLEILDRLRKLSRFCELEIPI
jgi:hypothetical protein